eukprot:jgi/Mesen1/8418/ME000472S07784
MESNRDDAEKCFAIGSAALQAGDVEKALRFLHRAQKLYPSQEVADLIDEIMAEEGEAEEGEVDVDGDRTEASANGHVDDTSTSGGVRQRHTSTSTARPSPPPSSSSSPNSTSSQRRAAAGGGPESGAAGAGRAGGGFCGSPRAAARQKAAGGAGGGGATGAAAGAGAGGGVGGGGVQATRDQIEIVRRIRKTSDYYEILAVERACSDDDLKRAYRKWSLRVHPDKNKAPGADEAFKAVSKAFQCLSSPDMRANYDRYGHEDPQALQRQRQHRAAAAQHHQYQQYGFGGSGGGGGGMFYEDAFDPNDIFNAFFGGMGMNAHHHHHSHPNSRVFRASFGGGGVGGQQQRAARHAHARGSGGGAAGGPNVNLLAIMQLIPILAIILYALMPAAEPAYKLQRQDPYLSEKRTSAYQVPYYVRSASEFDREYPLGSRARRSLEHGVDSEYAGNMQTRCYYEKVQQNQFYRWGQAAKAREMPMPYCDELRRFQNAY